MADGNGGSRDLLLQLLDGQKKLQGTVDGLEKRMDGLDRRLDNTNGTLTLLGRVLNELTGLVKKHLEDHEARLAALEKKVVA